MKHIKRNSGFFFGLNGESAEQAFISFLDDKIDLFENAIDAIQYAESERKKGNFFDDNATITIYKYTRYFEQMSFSS